MTTMAVMNAAADRQVKLAQNFLESSKSEESYQNVLQVVELPRKKNSQTKGKRSVNKFYHYSLPKTFVVLFNLCLLDQVVLWPLSYLKRATPCYGFYYCTIS